MLDLLDHDLDPLERLHVFLVRRAHGSASAGSLARFYQRRVAVRCIDQMSRRILDVAGDDRVPAIDPRSSVIVVCNHSSPFDLSVAVSWLVTARRLRHRLLFPVRADFFYRTPLGLAVNAATGMSMYPPLFNVPRRAAQNLAALEETIRAVHAQPTVLGLHPEGTQRSTGDPYELSPGQSGMGRVLYHARVPVIPVFLRGLDDDLVTQMLGGLTGTAPPVLAVFGEPVELDELRRSPPSTALYRKIAQRAVDDLTALGAEEHGRRVARGLIRETPPPASGEQLRAGLRAHPPVEQAARLRAAQ